MRHSHRLVLATLALLVGCDGWAGGTFFVVAENRAPLAGVRIEREDSWATGQTDSNGFANVGHTAAPGHYTVAFSISKAGFVPCRVEIPTLSENVVEVTLKRTDLGTYTVNKEARRPCAQLPAEAPAKTGRSRG